ncbi:hypothetical protein WOLCODRAFT_139064 [Wolfiporia cocos MD-104 SS10]|uniref:Uncharacterized protein n=1 Tax=Wolfiporia cocos (strain MD-104) TaxID=742152 RepID=A0A2H3K7X7_WOLCO|nr:hypothetical protein WOLCODRAFT_139064 [Wolfiporia cocos MD-104 SS10]
MPSNLRYIITETTFYNTEFQESKKLQNFVSLTVALIQPQVVARVVGNRTTQHKQRKRGCRKLVIAVMIVIGSTRHFRYTCYNWPRGAWCMLSSQTISRTKRERHCQSCSVLSNARGKS